jgi:hypothetical protein
MSVYSFEEFLGVLKREGLEAFGLYYGSYKGEVVSNEDPENVGRLRIKCAAMYGDEEFADWVFPKGVVAGNKAGVLWLPQPGDPIYLSCENGNVRFPVWEYGWWLRDRTIDGHSPKVQAFVTPYGHRIELNDEDKFIDITHPSGFHVKLYEDGIFIGKEEDNLGKRLDDLFQLFVDTTVSTPGGPAPFNNIIDYSTLRTQLGAFLKTS